MSRLSTAALALLVASAAAWQLPAAAPLKCAARPQPAALVAPAMFGGSKTKATPKAGVAKTKPGLFGSKTAAPAAKAAPKKVVKAAKTPVKKVVKKTALAAAKPAAASPFSALFAPKGLVVSTKNVDKKPVAKKPVAKKPVAKKPVAKKPVAKKATPKPVAKAAPKPVAQKVAPRPVKKAVPKRVIKETVAPKRAPSSAYGGGSVKWEPAWKKAAPTKAAAGKPASAGGWQPAWKTDGSMGAKSRPVKKALPAKAASSRAAAGPAAGTVTWTGNGQKVVVVAPPPAPPPMPTQPTAPAKVRFTPNKVPQNRGGGGGGGDFLPLIGAAGAGALLLSNLASKPAPPPPAEPNLVLPVLAFTALAGAAALVLTGGESKKDPPATPVPMPAPAAEATDAAPADAAPAEAAAPAETVGVVTPTANKVEAAVEAPKDEAQQMS